MNTDVVCSFWLSRCALQVNCTCAPAVSDPMATYQKFHIVGWLYPLRPIVLPLPQSPEDPHSSLPATLETLSVPLCAPKCAALCPAIGYWYLY